MIETMIMDEKERWTAATGEEPVTLVLSEYAYRLLTDKLATYVPLDEEAEVLTYGGMNIRRLEAPWTTDIIIGFESGRVKIP